MQQMPQAQANPAEQQWADWAATQKIGRRYRKRAVQAALNAIGTGASSEQAAEAGRAAAKGAELDEWATAALVLGGLSAVISFFTGGFSILFSVLSVVGGVRGFKSPHRQWQAIVGLVLAALGVVFFIIAHVIS